MPPAVGVSKVVDAPALQRNVPVAMLHRAGGTRRKGTVCRSRVKSDPLPGRHRPARPSARRWAWHWSQRPSPRPGSRPGAGPSVAGARGPRVVCSAGPRGRRCWWRPGPSTAAAVEDHCLAPVASPGCPPASITVDDGARSCRRRGFQSSRVHLPSGAPCRPSDRMLGGFVTVLNGGWSSVSFQAERLRVGRPWVT